MTGDLAPLIVGAGPAGMMAAAVLAAAGLRPTVVDEGARPGGQIFRLPAPGDERPFAALYGPDAPTAQRLHDLFAGLKGRIDYLPETLVWSLGDGIADLACGDRLTQRAFSHLMLCTGATDRVLPMAGWTLPGVFSLGAAQVALKAQGCAIGSRTVFVGSGPLLYVVADQYAAAGAAVAAVLDTAPLSAKRHLLRGLRDGAGTVWRGVATVARLKARRVPIHFGARPLRIEGDGRVSGLIWSDGAGETRIDCDAVGIGFGLRPETQLADLAGCAMTYDGFDRAYRPVRDAAGRASRAHVYVAGDGAGIGGADAARLAGERAALALLADAGHAVDAGRAAVLDAELARLHRLRRALADAFPLPDRWAADLDDAVTVCRCEGVTAGAIRAAAADFDLTEMNRLKAVTRTGMGRCQGRMCGAAASELLAVAAVRPHDGVGRLRGQCPVKPLSMTATAVEDRS